MSEKGTGVVCGQIQSYKGNEPNAVQLETLLPVSVVQGVHNFRSDHDQGEGCLPGLFLNLKLRGSFDSKVQPQIKNDIVHRGVDGWQKVCSACAEVCMACAEVHMTCVRVRKGVCPRIAA